MGRELTHKQFLFFSKRHCKDTMPKFRSKYSQKWNCAATVQCTVPIPTFMFLWAIYIFPWSVCLFCSRKISGPNVGIYRSITHTHECGNWDWGRAIPFHTVTRPYAGFRHPDRMAPDQTVRGGENDCFIWSGNFLAQIPKFSRIFQNPGIFQRFTWSSVRGVPFLCRYFTFLDAGRHFRNFPDIYPVKKWESAQGRSELSSSGILHHTSISTPQLPYDIW